MWPHVSEARFRTYLEAQTVPEETVFCAMAFIFYNVTGTSFFILREVINELNQAQLVRYAPQSHLGTTK